MTEIKEEELTDIEKVEEQLPTKRLVFPEMCSWVDDDEEGYDIEIYLPGVDRDSITLKMHEDRFYVRGETDSVRYLGEYVMCCPMDRDRATATYKEGLLKIHVPFKDIFEEAKQIEIK